MSSSVCTSSRQSPPISDKIIHHQFGLNTANNNPLQSIGTMVEQLDRIYELVRKLLTDYQSVTTGLFPRYSIDQNIGYVKDSIYCALACWACSLAYKRIDDGRGREMELCQTAVKTMRGILFLWMRQVDKINSFKQNNAPQFSLHSRFDLHNGNELASITTFLHLQMDTIAIYILALVQMTVAGAQIIYTSHEVAFFQNLVFYIVNRPAGLTLSQMSIFSSLYEVSHPKLHELRSSRPGNTVYLQIKRIERTYRTPDFGIWERGTRYNQGVPELHASSLGLVKAALESVNGFNVYGLKGNSESVIYVDIDGHNRNRTTFETLLPRESNSKNTDAALLLTIGWPAFATHDQHLLEATMAKCLRYLEGSYGLKRFLRDGYMTELENQTKRYYDDEETSQFSKIESQFPMFLAIISITAHFKGNNSLAEKYWLKFQDLLVEFDPNGHDHNNHLLCPECYCIDEEHMEEERKWPNSQKYYPLSHREFGHHLWSNAIFIVGTLLREKLIHLSDIDPICRHLPASERPKYMPINMSAAFHGGMEGRPVVQIALISESTHLQMLLSTYGITTQTPHEIEPIQIWPSWRMVKLMEHLGRDDKLGLNGRPLRPLGALNTSKIFRVCGNIVLIYPLIFELSDFYTNADPVTLIDDIKRELEFVSKRWKLAGRPTFCIILREENVAGEYLNNMLDLLVDIKNGMVNGVRVRLGRIHQLINTGCLEQFDMVDPDSVDFDVEIMSEREGKETKQLAKSHFRMAPSNGEELAQERDFVGKDDQILYQIIAKNDAERLRIMAISIAIMQKRYSHNFMVQGESLSTRMERIYRQACQQQNNWWLVRYCAAKLAKKIINLAPSITNLLVRGKQIIIGHKSCREILISTPSTPVELQNAIFSSCDPNEPHATVFQQELIVACSDLISQNADAFDGILTIRLAWYTDAISTLLSFSKEDLARRKRREAEGKEMPPTMPMTKNSIGSEFFDLVSFLESICPISVVKKFKLGKEFGIYDFPPTVVKKLLSALMMKKEIWHLLSPLQIRKLNGALNRVPINLYDRVWKILERVQQGIIISGHILPQYPTLQIMTRHELNFSYKVESMMSDITHPEYRQLIVELLCIVATLMERNPEIHFMDALDCDQLLEQAFNLFCEEHRIKDRVEMSPFYAVDDDPSDAPTSSYLIRVVVDKLLKDTNIRHRISAPSIGFGEKLSRGSAKKDDECSII